MYVEDYEAKSFLMRRFSNRKESSDNKQQSAEQNNGLLGNEESRESFLLNGALWNDRGCSLEDRRISRRTVL